MAGLAGRPGQLFLYGEPEVKERNRSRRSLLRRGIHPALLLATYNEDSEGQIIILVISGRTLRPSYIGLFQRLPQ